MSTQLSIHDVDRIILEDGSANGGDTIWIRLKFYCQNREMFEVVAFPVKGGGPLRVAQPDDPDFAEVDEPHNVIDFVGGTDD